MSVHSATISATPAPAVVTGMQVRSRRWSRQVAMDVVGLGDALAVMAGSALPALIYGNMAGVVTNWTLLIQASVAGAIITCLCLRSWQMYDTASVHDLPVSTGRLMAALLISIVGVSGLGMPHAVQNEHIIVWMLTWFAASNLLLQVNRHAARTLLKRFTLEGRFHERVAVFGAGEIARRVQEHLSDPKLSIQLAGVYDDRAEDLRIDSTDLEISGRLDDLIAAARNEEIDQVIIALPQGADRRIATVARKLEQLPASVHIVTHIASDLVDPGSAHKVSSLGTVGLLDVKRKALADWAPLVKKLEDFVLGTLILLLFLPLFPLIALAIKLDSKGPVFFVQRRRGLNHRIIEVIKFRTMTVLEDGDAIPQAMPGDMRVTAVGRFLRRASMDELPQLWNVLKGEMSLVGPRPHALVHDERFGELLENYANRHQVKPGITGLAQVMGFRGEASTPGKIEARVNADIDYIRNWSLGLDLWILGKTVSAVIKGENAH